MERYPDIEPSGVGMMDTGDGNQIYWEVSGNPGGRPVLVLHGGPGSGTTPGGRRNWDPTKYRIVQMDQRNCGRSRPLASEPTLDLSNNTTSHLIADIEQLRELLEVDRWVLWGGSWGVTLALAYAQTYPERVRAMILVSVTVTRPSDVHWLAHEAGRFLPEQWHAFRAGVPEAERDGDLVAAYYRLLNESGDPAAQREAARNWCLWEDAVVSLEPGATPDDRFEDADFRMLFARLVTHYFHHAAWLAENQLLRDAHKLRGIPGVLIHGRLDISGPADVPWLLAQQWSDAELHIVPETGHRGGARTTRLILEAAQRFAES